MSTQSKRISKAVKRDRTPMEKTLLKVESWRKGKYTHLTKDWPLFKNRYILKKREEGNTDDAV